MGTTDTKGNEVLAKLKGNGQVAEKKPQTLKEWFAEPEFKGKIVMALPKVINSDAFITNAYNIYLSSKELQKCTLVSFLDALMDAAKVGLMPNSPLKHCDIIPYKDHGVMTAHFQMEYRGHVDLALRTGMYSSIYAHEVYPQDEFDACYGLNKNLIHIPSKDPIPEGTKPIYYYAVYKLKNGGFDFVYWTRDRVLKHRDTKSKSYISAKKGGYEKSNTWVTDEVAMGKKTMLIQVLNTSPKSVEMQRALSTEPEGEHLKSYFKKDKDIFENVPDMPIQDAEVTETVDKKTGEVKDNAVLNAINNIEKNKKVRKENTAENFISKEDIPGATK